MSAVREQDGTEPNLIEKGEGSLFGDSADDDELGSERETGNGRKLDDAELDSGDDEDRLDRIAGGEHDQDLPGNGLELRVVETSLGRHAVPLGTDGETYHLRFPDNVAIEPKTFTLEGFAPPTSDHHSSGPASSTFSAYETAITTVRWRYSPTDPSRIQSNARILRWSDGSLTLQNASNPLDQYMFVPKILAPPQVNPNKPTPTSLQMPNLPRNAAIYDSNIDEHEYLAAPHEKAGLLRTINHITTGLTLQSSQQDDAALFRLQESLAAASKGTHTTAGGGPEVISITEDPELAKKRAELAEKEKIKSQRRSAQQQERASTRASNLLNRSGLRNGTMGAGLSVGGLEDELGMGATRTKIPARKTRRRNSEYSDDEEDFRGRGRNREDEYDEDDGFLVGSDEEPEVGEESEEEDVEMDAEGEDDEDATDRPDAPKPTAAAAANRTKQKRVIEDDDEE